MQWWFCQRFRFYYFLLKTYSLNNLTSKRLRHVNATVPNIYFCTTWDKILISYRLAFVHYIASGSGPFRRGAISVSSHFTSDVLFVLSASGVLFWFAILTGVSPWSLKLPHTAHMCGGPKQVWGDQKAGWPENLLALRAGGTRVSSWPSNVGDKTFQ